MISKKKRKLINIAALIGIWFWGILGCWLIAVFGLSMWFVFISLVGIFGSFIIIILNEPCYIEYFDSLNSQKTSIQNMEDSP